jgi:hypothetical protein
MLKEAGARGDDGTKVDEEPSVLTEVGTEVAGVIGEVEFQVMAGATSAGVSENPVDGSDAVGILRTGVGRGAETVMISGVGGAGSRDF